jgi:hypothetical protein
LAIKQTRNGEGDYAMADKTIVAQKVVKGALAAVGTGVIFAGVVGASAVLGHHARHLKHGADKMVKDMWRWVAKSNS